MKPLLADTSFFVALLCEGDTYHAVATRWSSEMWQDIVTTPWILAEVANVLRRKPERVQFAPFVARLQASPEVQILPADESIFNAGVSLYAARPDKDWSLTDCISFVAMERLGLEDALTADHHFTQAGFRVLLG